MMPVSNETGTLRWELCGRGLLLLFSLDVSTSLPWLHDAHGKQEHGINSPRVRSASEV